MPKFLLANPIKTDVPVFQVATKGDTDRAQVTFNVPIENDQGQDLGTVDLAPVRVDDKSLPDDIRQKLRDVGEYLAKREGKLTGDAVEALGGAEAAIP